MQKPNVAKLENPLRRPLGGRLSFEQRRGRVALRPFCLVMGCLCGGGERIDGLAIANLEANGKPNRRECDTFLSTQSGES